ncbi:hypothetical protein SEPCBS119000_003588 [Sporothrix epigloea]|uniref:Proteophosphoglycan ppg4 n=1 Tax=Sporothrix epigloea TaxID=1892477 RepID=A0ABP0DRP3_9PEZI
MPRFGFSVSSWRHKEEPAAIISSPLSKAQKLLGSSQINIDSSIPSATSEASKFWHASADPYTNINVSQGALPHKDGDEASTMPKSSRSMSASGPTARQKEDFEEESDLLSRAFVAHGNEHFSTDTLSLRRKQSSSTITSYYERSRVPLGDSQHPSDSSMTRGLSRKASSLLDIDGSISQAASTRKRPSRLGLSKMFSNHRSSSALNLDAERARSLSIEPAARRPSVPAATPLEYLARPIGGKYSHQRLPSTPPGPDRKETRKSFSEFSSPRRTFPDPKQRLAATSQRVADLQNLYDHYEQMSFRDVLAEENEVLSGAVTPIDSHTAMLLPLNEVLSICPEVAEKIDADDRPQQVSHRGPLNKDIPAYLRSCKDVAPTIQIATSDLPSIQIIEGDCSDSISSRHTRTSKASKRTAHSFLEIDLHQTSVLSLSSDSEDDLVDSRIRAPSKWVPLSTRSQSDMRMSYQESYRPTTSRSLSLNKKKDKFRTSSCSDPVAQFSPVLEPRASRSVSLLPATVYFNPSSASATTGSTKNTTNSFAHNVRSSSRDSRTSVASNRTTNSAASLVSSTVQEARAIALVSAQGASYDSAMSQRHLSTPENSAPSLTFPGIDPAIRTNRSSVCESEQGSIRSTIGSFSAESSAGPNAGTSRFMAVTRQEELLLASLRQKRLRMRGSIIAEYAEEDVEEEEEAFKQKTQSHQLPSPDHETRRVSIGAILDSGACRPRSTGQAPASFDDYSMHFEDSSFPIPPSSGNHNSLRRSSAISLPLSPRSKPPVAQLPSTPGSRPLAFDTGLKQALLSLNSAAALAAASGRASNSGSGTDSGSGNTSTSGHSDDVFGCGNRDHRLSDCLDSGDDDSASIVSYESFDFGLPIDEPVLDRPVASQQKLQQLRRPSLHGDPCLFSGTAFAQSPPTVYDSDVHDAGTDADADGQCMIDDVDDDSITPYGDLVGTGHDGDRRQADKDEQGIPRPDSPLESIVFFHKKKALRISAVGSGISLVNTPQR